MKKCKEGWYTVDISTVHTTPCKKYNKQLQKESKNHLLKLIIYYEGDIRMEKVVVTYTNADLDCLASAYAYAEYLNKQGENANYYISGQLQKEVDIVCSLFDIELHNNIEEIGDRQVVVVDTNTLSSVSFVNPKQIVEVIDHHPESGDKFENATIDIQQIGAVCTMIAEKYKEKEIEISRESAILLYYGIVSNTVNFNSKVTTDRDREMAAWLKTQCMEIDDELIHRIFMEKSQFDMKDLRVAMEVEEKFQLGADELIIGQLEITDAKEFVKEHEEEINDIINQVKQEYGVSTIFINVIDILASYHLLYTPYEATRKLLSEDYGFQFEGSICEEPRIVLRKEIKRYMRNRLENNKKEKMER